MSWRATLRQIFVRPPGEDPVIDGLRGMASLSIVLFHSFYGAMFLLKDFERISSFINQLPPWLTFLLNTDKAVDLFFMVSGFLMGGALFRQMARSGRIAIGRFYLKRLFRIYPLFLLGIFLYAQDNLRKSFNNLIYNLLFIDNFRMKTIIPVGWSLSIEMQFYMILPFLIYGLWRLRESRRMAALKVLFALSFVAVALSALLNPVTYTTPMYLFHPERIDPSQFLDVMYYQSHTRFGPLVLGLIWAWQRELELRGNHPITQIKNIWWGLAGISLAGLWTFFPVYRQDSWFYADFSPWLNLACHTLHRGLFCLGVLMAVRHLRGISRFLGARFWRPFSQVVFPIYLFHFPMIAISGIATLQTLDMKSIQSITIWQVASIFVIAAALSLALGIVLHALVEQPMIRIGQRILAGKISGKVTANQIDRANKVLQSESGT